jgi:hypothetical protein
MGDEDGAAVLVMSDEWVLDELARDRMGRQLARAPEDTAGIVAVTGELPAGSSYRVHAERSTLLPSTALSVTGTRCAQGAVLLRPGLAFESNGDLVEVERGALWVDPGVHAHDPWRPLAPLEAASRLGRPPFPRRPVVVLLGCGDDLDLADSARTLTNDLVRRDVEARLAVPEATEGLHLTQPCLPCAETIGALAPDVIVALDETALDRAPEWCRNNRSTVLVELVIGVAGKLDLVSWRLGNASGRLRARVDERIDPDDLVELVKRLCSGPHPAPPVEMELPDEETVMLLPELKAKPRVTKRSLVVVSGTAELGAGALKGLVDNATVARGRAEHILIDDLSPRAETADVVLLASVCDDQRAHDLAVARAQDGRPTVVHLGPDDVGGDDQGALPVPSDDAVRLLATCGLAATPSVPVHRSLCELGVRAHLLPTLPERSRVVALRQARELARVVEKPVEGDDEAEDTEPVRVVGWQVAGGPTGPVVEAVRTLQSGRPDLRLEVAGDLDRLPEALLDEWWVSAEPGEIEPKALIRWAVQLWNPSRDEYEIAGDLRPLIEAGVAGVPTVVGMAGWPAPDDHAVHEVMIEHPDGPDAWLAHVGPLVDDEDAQAELARLVTRRADALFGAPTSAAVVNRFLGWALHGATT